MNDSDRIKLAAEDIEFLKTENTKLETELSAEKLKNQELQSKIDALELAEADKEARITALETK